jgi:serine/threonine-protein kinase
MSIVVLPREESLGRYRLCARLGRGGMAEVFLARLIGAGGFEKLVAVKRMYPHMSEDPQFVAMFLNEGRVAAELGHPNLCQIIELGEADGQLYIAMELLRGLSWFEIVPAIPDRPQSTFLRFIAGVIVQVCEGLHAAHTATDVAGRARPIVHRDVSPSNLFVTVDGIVKLLDFGVSKQLAGDGPATRTGTIKGKLGYMAPEQVRGQVVDVRADIFALGVVTWESIAGRPLFVRATDLETWKAVAEDPIPAVPGDGPVIAAIDAVVQRALSRDRDGRHATARDFAGDLRRAIADYGEPMSAVEIQTNLAQWLEPNLARRARDLAEVLGRIQIPDGERTTIHTPVAESGARMRDVSIVIERVDPHTDVDPHTTVDSIGDEAPTAERPAATESATTIRPMPVDDADTTERPVTPQPRASPAAAIAAAPPVTLVTTTPPITIEPTRRHPKAAENPWIVPAIVIGLLAIAAATIAAFAV